jgi:hypothetical protein
MLRIRAGDEFVLQTVADVAETKAELSRELGVEFDPPDTWAHGYPTRHAGSLPGRRAARPRVPGRGPKCWESVDTERGESRGRPARAVHSGRSERPGHRVSRPFRTRQRARRRGSTSQPQGLPRSRSVGPRESSAPVEYPPAARGGPPSGSQEEAPAPSGARPRRRD